MITYYYCIKDYKGFNIGFTKNKSYKAIIYPFCETDYILLIDDYKNEIDFRIKSIIGNDILTNHLIPIKDARKIKLEKLKNV